MMPTTASAGFPARQLAEFLEDLLKPLDMALGLLFVLLECSAQLFGLRRLGHFWEGREASPTGLPVIGSEIQQKSGWAEPPRVVFDDSEENRLRERN